MDQDSGIRLYRGLTTKYRPEEVRDRQRAQHSGTDFTDCPYRATQFARGANGTVLVLDVPSEAMEGVEQRVTEELYSLDGKGPKRFMLWGRFDDLLVAEIPAKELRAEVRRKGIVTLPDEDKSQILKDCIRQRLKPPPAAGRVRPGGVAL